MMRHATPDVPPVAAEFLTAIHHPATGRIVHLHRTTILRGGAVPSPADRAERAYAALRAMARRDGDTDVIEVDPADWRPGHRHHVDLATGRLVATPRAERA